MAARKSLDTTDMYFTPKEQVMKALGQRDEEPEYGEVLTDPIDPVYSNVPHVEYCEYDELEDEYVLPQETIKSKEDVTPRPRTKKDVEDLYDEDHYSLPDIKGCITKDTGPPKLNIDEKQPDTSSAGNKRKLSANKFKITALIILLSRPCYLII